MHFLAFGRSSFLIAKYAIIAPTIPKKIGKRYHQLLLDFSGYIILGYFFGLFCCFCTCFISISTVSRGFST